MSVAARAFLEGFLDGMTMEGLWNPDLNIPGAPTRLFRSATEDDEDDREEEDDEEWEEEIEL